MKLHYVFLLLGAVALSLIAVAVSVRPRARALPAAASIQNFEVKGQVRSVEADGKTVRIAHEDIPGFMPAMEMPFEVKEPAILRGIAPGDRVQFHLVVTKDDSWISSLKKIEGKQETRSASESVPQSANGSPSTAQMQIGEEVPDFRLVDQHGRPFHLRDFRGKAVVLTFIYTRCPLPNFCPLMSKNFASLQERFEKQLPGKVQLLSVSFDPEFDTPETLRRYASLYQHDDKNWSFATGTSERIDTVTGLFGLIREPSNGFINHDLRTALISPEGKLVHIWRSNVWTPYEVQRMVQETLQKSLALR